MSHGALDTLRRRDPQIRTGTEETTVERKKKKKRILVVSALQGLPYSEHLAPEASASAAAGRHSGSSNSRNLTRTDFYVSDLLPVKSL